MGELEDLREAQRIVREMIESARVRMRKQVAAALTIIDRPGYPDATTERERALIRDAATGIRHQYLIERGTTSVDWPTLLKRVGDDERRVLEAAHRARTTKREAREAKEQRAMDRWAKATAALTR